MAAKWAERLATYGRFIKFEHTLFSVPLLYAGAVLAATGWPTWSETLLIPVAAAGARAAALRLTRIIDVPFDCRNPRTKDRELPAGRMTMREAWGIVIASGIVYLVAAALLGRWCLLLAPVPLILF